MTNKICPECGTEQNSIFNYCKNCGALISDENNKYKQSKDNINPDEKSDNVKICPECGTEHEIFSKFCKNCGNSFFDENKNNDDIIRCSNCGVELNNEAFCPDCGKPTCITICPNCMQKTVNENFCSVCGYQINQNIKICTNCGNQIDARAKVCAHCGNKTIKKSPILALILSMIFPGLGQIYNNQNHKGTIIILGYIISVILCFIIVGLIFAFLIWIYAMYDAFISAKAITRGKNS